MKLKSFAILLILERIMKCEAVSVLQQKTINDETEITLKNEQATELAPIISRLLKLYDLHTILLRCANKKVPSDIDELLKNISSPVIRHDLMQTEALTEHNKQILILICPVGGYSDSETALDYLAQLLTERRETKIILYLEAHFAIDRYALLQALFRYCYTLKMLNVIAIFNDFGIESYFYAYSSHPELKVERHDLYQREFNFFPNRFKNLYGTAIRTLWDHVTLDTIFYTDKKGRQILGGHVGRLIQTLAWRLNASLHYPFNQNSRESTTLKDLTRLIKNDTLDVSAAVLPILSPADFKNHSYPYEVGKYCLMIPKATDVPIENIYMLLVRRRVSLLILATICIFNVLLNCRGRRKNLYCIWILDDVPLRGILGLPFRKRTYRGIYYKCICLLMFFCGLFLSTTFHAELKSLLTQPPRNRQIETFQDLYASGLQILTFNEERDLMLHYVSAPINFKMASSQERFAAWKTLNTSFAYLISSVIWKKFQEQQLYFDHNAFIFAPQTCFLVTIPLSLPLQPNSLYRIPLEDLILDVTASGLNVFWLRHAIYDIIHAGYTLESNSYSRKYGKSMSFGNFKWIWIAYLCSIFISFFVLLIEIVFNSVVRHFRKR